ncbi:uncharacterized protein PITG_21387 [Phytophthora infestans T30-4]|uniref:Uncharacterized protein n=1 Tax=Phytophthora infestans (strain T30-4) TaxID=403677 RepID=D0P3S5_PHYIT|nr:uncharacterized protein PITG_21387 [Phytophthora infestans T30-4]EEY61731.1 hypothetical protein PITG_21387 [Phytophthora infestans T30-4]|eukprot:XP_002895049.1 hypothetical protein PITG_21387 [Phytophthora infestans T30-4]
MAIQDIYSSVSAADIRQEAGKTDENAGEMLPAAVTSILQMIGEASRNGMTLLALERDAYSRMRLCLVIYGKY